MKDQRSSTLSLTSALYEGGMTTPSHSRFTPENDLVPTVQKAWCDPEPVWTGAENVASTRNRYPDRRARSEPLYQLQDVY